MVSIELFTNQGHCSGLQALHSIAAACKGFLGPERRVKLVMDDESCEAVFTTEKLLSLLDIEHPVGHLLREACLTQSKVIKLGCTTLVCMAGTWASAVQSLLDEGIPAETILLVGDEIINFCVKTCKELSINCSEVVDALQKRRQHSLLIKGNPQTERKEPPSELVERSQVCIMKSPFILGDGLKTDPSALGWELSSHTPDVVMSSKRDSSHVEDDLSWYFDADFGEHVCQESNCFSPIDEHCTTPAEVTKDIENSLDLLKVSGNASEILATDDDEDFGWYFEERSTDSKYREDAGDTSQDGPLSNKVPSVDLSKVFRNHGDSNLIRTRKINDGIDLEDNLGDCTPLVERTLKESEEEQTKSQTFKNEIRDLKTGADMIKDSSQNNIAPVRTFQQSTLNHVDTETTEKLFASSNGLRRNGFYSGLSLNTIRDIENQLKTLSANMTPITHQPTSRDKVLRSSRHFKTSQEHSDDNLEGVAEYALTNTRNKLGERSEILGQSLSPSRKEIRHDHESVCYPGENSFLVSPPAAREALNSSSEGISCSFDHSSKSFQFAEPLIKMPSTKGISDLTSTIFDDVVGRDNQRPSCPGDSLGGTKISEVSHIITAEQNSKRFPQNSPDCEGFHHGTDVRNTSSKVLSDLTDNYEEVHAFEKLCEGLSHGAELSMQLAKQLCLKQLENRMQYLDPFVCDVVGPSVKDSAIIDGLLLRCQMDQLPLVSMLRSKPLRAVLINGDLTPGFKHPGFKGHMEVKQFTHSLSHAADSRNSWLDKVTHILQELKISLVLVKGHVDVKLMDHCLAQGVLVISLVPYLALEYFSDVTDTPANVYFSDIAQDDVCDNLQVDCWEAGWHSVIRKRETQRTAFVNITGRSSLQTVVLCGPSHPHVEEQLAKFWSSYYKLRDLLKTKTVCLGGAVTELNILKNLERRKDSLKRPDCSHQDLMKGRVIEAFQEGIEEFIIWLVSNRGDYSKFDVKTAVRNFVTGSCQQTEAVQEMFCCDCQSATSVDPSAENKKPRRNSSTHQDAKFANNFQRDLIAGPKVRSIEDETTFQSVVHRGGGSRHDQGISATNTRKNGMDVMTLLSDISGAGTCRQICETDGIVQPDWNKVDCESLPADTTRKILPSTSDDSKNSKQEYRERNCKTAEIGLTETKDDYSHNGFFCSCALSANKNSPLNVYEWGTVVDSVTSKTEAWQNGWSLIKLIMSMDCILTTGLKQTQLQSHHNLLL